MGGSDWKHYHEIPPRQPFLLRALAKSAEILEDPDWRILTEGQDSYCTGVRLGYDVTHSAFAAGLRAKAKHRRFDDDLPAWDRANYASAQLSSQQLLDKFRSEVDLGRMQATTLGALKERYPEDRIRIAFMGAIQKGDGSVRPVHDATHGVHVNQGIKQLNLLAADVAWVVRQACERRETPFAITADVSAAHRLALIRERDWFLIACRAEEGSPTVFVNKVGTFGVSSASLWWSRLFGIIGRVVGTWTLGVRKICA